MTWLISFRQRVHVRLKKRIGGHSGRNFYLIIHAARVSSLFQAKVYSTADDHYSNCEDLGNQSSPGLPPLFYQQISYGLTYRRTVARVTCVPAV